MSWVIKADAKIIRTEEDDELKVGDKVRVLPWEGESLDLEYQTVLLSAGPEAVITGGKQFYEFSGESGEECMQVEMPNGVHWLVKPEHLEAA